MGGFYGLINRNQILKTMADITLTISVSAEGDFTEQELKDYVRMCMGFGGCSCNNPFIDEDQNAEVTEVEFEP